MNYSTTNAMPLILSPKIKNSWNLEVLTPHIMKSKSYWTKMKQNNLPELQSLLSSKIYNENGSRNRFTFLNKPL